MVTTSGTHLLHCGHLWTVVKSKQLSGAEYLPTTINVIGFLSSPVAANHVYKTVHAIQRNQRTENNLYDLLTISLRSEGVVAQVLVGGQAGLLHSYGPAHGARNMDFGGLGQSSPE